MFTGPCDNPKEFLKTFHERFGLGTVSRGPGKLQFFGSHFLQEEDNSVIIDVEDKLNALYGCSLSGKQRNSMILN